ncbi:Methyltransferase domain-containing protein [Raineyella antarctica]|uniref:Methyltransferase domain-containing protein n=1 Tax=Raineyella antarctica TaxID=1577474 RepID=A0A1G6GNH2_9ACTN|nr:class I SAM-dependent methyltransferase [Raineyella antarctica]SDB83499.1 Methyltransferase domain-containing protein [Raineyella antarctica]
MSPIPGGGAVAVFDEHAGGYDSWFDAHPDVFGAELAAIAGLLDPVRTAAGPQAQGLEIGVGTGRFAAALGVGQGLEPAPRMAAIARSRGISVVRGLAEALPYARGCFTWTLFVTSLCFVVDPARALVEARRVTRSGGVVLVAYLNRASPEGRDLAAHRAESPYYSQAHLLSTAEVEALLQGTGLVPDEAAQVLTDAAGRPEVVRGANRGLFCVVRARVR